MRKGYHLLAVGLFLPALLLEPQLLGVALGGAFLALLAVEAARLSGLPGIGVWRGGAGLLGSEYRLGAKGRLRRRRRTASNWLQTAPVNKLHA